MATTAYPADQFRPLNSSTLWRWEDRERAGITYRGLTPVNQPDTFAVRLETPLEATNARLRLVGYKASANSFTVTLRGSFVSGVQISGATHFGPDPGWINWDVPGYTWARGATHLLCSLSPGDLLVGGWATWQPGPGEFFPSVGRYYDSRSDYSQWGQTVGKFYPYEERWLALPVPSTVGSHAAALNVTVTQTEGSGWLTVYPPGPYPGTSTLNWSGPGQTLANNVQAGVGPVVGGLGVLLRNGPSRTHVVVDLLGYYRAAVVLMKY